MDLTEYLDWASKLPETSQRAMAYAGALRAAAGEEANLPPDAKERLDFALDATQQFAKEVME